jgi:CRP/FNR family transcriptional regulator, cyclic AMP receptor protein
MRPTVVPRRRTHLASVAPAVPPFSAEAFLEWAGGQGAIVRYGQGDPIFAEGDPCRHVLYIWSGGVKVSAQSRVGKEAVVAVLGTGDFFGEACLAGQDRRNRTAVAIKPSAVLPVERGAMARLLQDQHAVSNRFISHVLTRNIRMAEDLVAQLLGAAEMRLARTLLRMARFGEADAPAWARITAEALAELAGTTVPRAKACLESFAQRRFIEYHDDGRLKINRSLLTVVLRD